jgi:hypothetical protein
MLSMYRRLVMRRRGYIPRLAGVTVLKKFNTAYSRARLIIATACLQVFREPRA